MNHRKYMKGIGVSLFLALLLSGCATDSYQAPDDKDAPHRIIAEVVDFEAEPAEIEMHYTRTGQDWLRMSFPEPTHREYAVKHIGRHVPDVTFTTLKGTEHSLRDIKEPTIFYFTQTDSSITKEMAGYMETFQNEHKDVAIYTLYPTDVANEVEKFYEDNALTFDESIIAVGDDVSPLIEGFSITESPLLVYVDETQTISYTAIGFRDLVFMNDHADAAFGEHRFYEWMDINFEPEELTAE